MQVGVKCPRGDIEWEECKRCRLNPRRPCHMPLEILSMIEREDRPHSSFTPSRLTGCDRQVVLLEGKDYYEDINHAWPAIRGTMIHGILEKSGLIGGFFQTLREVRLSTVLAGHTIEQDFNPADATYQPGQENFTGKPDLILLDAPDFSQEVITINAKIIDYKTTTIDHELTAAKKNHVRQINMYAWLVERELGKHLGNHVKVEVTELEIYYLDYKKVRRFTSVCSLQDRGKLVDRKNKVYENLTLKPIPLVDRKITEEWILKRINEKKAASLDNLPPMLPESESWLCFYCPVRDECYKRGTE